MGDKLAIATYAEEDDEIHDEIERHRIETNRPSKSQAVYDLLQKGLEKKREEEREKERREQEPTLGRRVFGVLRELTWRSLTILALAVGAYLATVVGGFAANWRPVIFAAGLSAFLLGVSAAIGAMVVYLRYLTADEQATTALIPPLKD